MDSLDKGMFMWDSDSGYPLSCNWDEVCTYYY